MNKVKYRYLNLVTDTMGSTYDLDKLIYWILSEEDQKSLVILKEDQHGIRIIDVSDCRMNYDAIEMTLLESIL